jgi:hypothetical protein
LNPRDRRTRYRTDNSTETTRSCCSAVISGNSGRVMFAGGCRVVLEAERWLELRRFRALRQAGASISEIARETGLNWRTVKKYLKDDGPAAPPVPPRAGRGRQMISEYAPVIDAWLRAEVLLKGTVIHERLAEEYGFTGNYQRVKMYLQEARPRIAAELGYTPAELARLHRRFEGVPGAQAQVDWGMRAASSPTWGSRRSTPSTWCWATWTSWT